MTINKYKRIQSFLKKEEDIICASIDRSFRILLIIEWFAGIAVAYYFSPKTWSGIESKIHIHLIAAIFLGGAILFPPVILGFLKPGAKITRYAISCGQMLFGCLLIHLMGGRSEAHFYLFGTLAFLAAYRKWQVLIPATIIVTLDHMIRGVYWPQSIYGVVSGAEWRWLEHAFWIIFEDIFLVVSIIQGRKDMKKIAETSINLEIKNREVEKMNKNLSAIVEERTRESRENALLAHHNSKLASIGALAAGVGHEINNPLTVIQGNIKSISKKLPEALLGDDQIGSSIYKIEVALKRVSGIVAGLRAFARNDVDTDTVFGLVAPLKQTVLLIEEIYKKEGIVINVNIINEDVYVLGNVGKLQQVFMNLISNAKDAISDVENPVIELTLSVEGDDALIIVKDNGHGMSKEIQSKVFDAFFTTKALGFGTGIGLSLSHSIVHEHKGNISFDSSDKGTSFYLRIPLTEKPLETVELTRSKIDEKPWSGRKVLVVDDEEMVREVIAISLEDEELDVTAVSSGKEALKLLKEGLGFDYIFCDMQMPNMNGLELIAKIENIELSKTPQIVVVTGGIDKKIESLSTEYSLVIGFLLKPFSDDDLKSILLLSTV